MTSKGSQRQVDGGHERKRGGVGEHELYDGGATVRPGAICVPFDVERSAAVNEDVLDPSVTRINHSVQELRVVLTTCG
jgi:hypothetical protein